MDPKLQAELKKCMDEVEEYLRRKRELYQEWLALTQHGVSGPYWY